MKILQALILLALLGVLNQAAAVRQLSEAATEPADLKQLLPHKDANGVWQPANTTGVDFDTLTLENLPAPEVFLEIAMTSPYPMPQIPMALLVNNTVNQWAGGKPPASVQDWLLLVQGAGNYVSSTLPNFLVKLLPNITLPDGQKLSIGEEAGKILTSALNGTLELPVPEEMAAAAGLNKPDSMDLIKGINVTLEVVKKLPALLKQVAQNMAQGVNSLGMPNVDLFNDDGTLDVAGLLKSVLNIEISTPTLPPAPDASQILAGVAKALPVVASQLGLNTSAIKFPDPAAVEAVLKKANGDNLFVTDRLGRVDLLATLLQLPQKVPEVSKVVETIEAVTKPPQGWPSLEDVAMQVVKTVLSPPDLEDVARNVVKSVAKQVQASRARGPTV